MCKNRVSYHRTLFTAILAVINMTLYGDLTAAELNAHDVIARSDTIRNPRKPFSVAVDMLEYSNGKAGEMATLTVFSKLDKDGGQYRSLVRYLSPTRDTGKVMLKNGNDMWFYDPNSDSNIRISPQQRLLGQASNGDVVTVNLAKDYTAEIKGSEEIIDGEQHKRACIKLALRATASDVTYDHLELWVDQERHAPIKAKFYSESDSLLKIVFYRKYASELGESRPTEMVIIDGLNPKLVTIMRYSKYQSREIPDAHFQRDYMPKFVGE